MHRAKLYAHRHGAWRQFAPVGETQRELRDEDTLLVTGPPGSANRSTDVFMDSGGSFIHTVIPSSGQLEVLAFDTPSELRHVQTLEVPDLRHALISNDDSHVYAVTSWSLLVFERDAGTGRLTQVTQVADAGLWGLGLQAMAISSDDRYLFVFDDNGKRTALFQLEDDPSNPHFLDTLPPFWNGFGTGTTSAGSPVREGEPRRLTYSARIWPSAYDGNRNPVILRQPTTLHRGSRIASTTPCLNSAPLETSWRVPMADTHTWTPEMEGSWSSSASESVLLTETMPMRRWGYSQYRLARLHLAPFRLTVEAVLD